MLTPRDYPRAEGYESLALAIGVETTNKMIDQTIKNYRSAGQDVPSLGVYLKHECRKLALLAAHFHRLTPCLLTSQAPCVDLDTAVEQAADWIIDCSNTNSSSQEVVKKVINKYLKGAFLPSFDDLERLHRDIAPNADTIISGIYPNDSPLPSVFSRRALCLQQLNNSRIPKSSVLYPQYLFAWIVGYHPFSDGNGRTARAAYAITAIKNGCWLPLPWEHERKLSGLGRSIIAPKVFIPRR